MSEKEKDREKERERERGGEGEENTRTKERVRQTQEKAGAGMAQSLSCNVVKHPNRISNDPGRLLPICFDIPSSACLVCAEQINDDFLR